GSSVTGLVTISASASSSVGVAGVQFKLDGSNFGYERTSAPYSIIWDTTQTSNGPHTVTAVARNTAGILTTSAAVTVTNVSAATAPSISITSPASGAVLTGTVNISAS